MWLICLWNLQSRLHGTCTRVILESDKSPRLSIWISFDLLFKGLILGYSIQAYPSWRSSSLDRYWEKRLRIITHCDSAVQKDHDSSIPGPKIRPAIRSHQMIVIPIHSIFQIAQGAPPRFPSLLFALVCFVCLFGLFVFYYLDKCVFSVCLFFIT